MKNKAFTLIELLVVVAIIGILAAVGVVSFSGFTDAAKANVVKSNHKTVINFISAGNAPPSISAALSYPPSPFPPDIAL